MIRSAALAIVLVACVPPEPAPQGPMAPLPQAGGPAPGSSLPAGDRPGDRPNDPEVQPPEQPEQPGAESDPMRILEAEIVAATNRLRDDPKAYADELRTYRSYYDERGYIHFPGRDVPIVSMEGRSAVDEAIKAAEVASRADPMVVSPGLTRAAREHAEEIGAAGTIDHHNSKMEQPHHRMERYGVIIGYSGENIGTGDVSGDNMIAGLFVDDGVSSRGHRTNLLTKAFRRIGVGCSPHIKWEVVCVIDYAEGYRER